MFGAEAYWVKDRFEKDRSNCHIYIGAKNENGRRAINDALSEANITGFYGQARLDIPLILGLPKDDVIVTSACFLPDTKVLTKWKVKRICDVQPGDMVLTHKGRWRPVISPTQREYSGKMYVIDAEGCTDKVVCTADHKFPVVQKTHDDVTREIVWKAAKDLNTKDRILSAVDSSIDCITTLNVDDYIGDYRKQRNDSGRKNKSPIIEDTIEITPLFLQALGLYIAEGNSIKSKNYLNFTIDSDKQELIKLIDDFSMKYVGKHVSMLPKKSQRATSVLIHSKELALFVTSLVGEGAQNKRVPDFVMGLSPSLQMEFLKGLFLGDGHLNKNQKRVVYVTISELLVKQVEIILERNNIKACTRFTKEYTDKDGVHHQKAFYLEINSSEFFDYWSNYIFDDKSFDYENRFWNSKKWVEIDGVHYFHRRVTSISSYEYQGTVHCLNVDEDHSFRVDCLSTHNCIAGWRYDDADAIWEEFAKHFGKNFFFEVQYHNTPSQIELNKRILRLRDKLNVPIIMGCDSHYIYENQSQERVDFLYSKGLEYPEEVGWHLSYPDGQTAYNWFLEQDVLTDAQIREAMDNTNVFLDVEEYDSPIFNTEIKMPTLYPGWTQEQRDEEYKRLVWSKWDEYKKEVSPERYPEYEKEIQREIDIVINTKMSDYFILNYHVIKKGIENGGQITRTGRGSGCSFLTNKLLGFSDIDRLSATVKMYPERFMSVERILQSGSLADIDHNVSNPEPFALAQQQVLGENCAYPMIAYGTMKSSAAWKLYAKSQDVEFAVANEVSNQLKRYELAVKHADEDSKDDISPLDYIDPQYHEIFERSKEYRGLISSWSIAPCSYLLYSGNIREEIGLVKIKDHLCCLMDGHWAEEGHFLKSDILTVKVVDLIYQTYRRIGREPPKVKELLEMCPPDDPVWDIYSKSCTLGINQVEQKGTSARVAVYKPKNISELSAFIAAIRPGFKSMYKTFESREPFSYGVKAFDSLMQSEEMPNSFVMYQEQEMAALNYAGISMSDAYTAIKNIAKKRTEKVLAYKDIFKSGFQKAMIEQDGKTEEEAVRITDRLWTIIEDSAAYVFNASHSYCVALDSLYSAWVKAHYPLEFYETLLRIAYEKGDKNKMAEIKEEAENYFNIKFPPFRFGQDNRYIVADRETNSIINTISSVKGFGITVGRTLYECSKHNFRTFMEVIQWLYDHKIFAAKIEPLIKIDYFQQFGNAPTLLKILAAYEFFKEGEAKTVRKDKVEGTWYDLLLQEYATDRNAKGAELKTYTITDMKGLLLACERYIRESNLPDFDYKMKMANQLEHLGYVDLTTGKEEDRRKLVITDVYPMKSKDNGQIWGYAIKTKSIGSGKVGRMTVKTQLYDRKPIQQGEIIEVPMTGLWKNKSGYWYLQEYAVIA